MIHSSTECLKRALALPRVVRDAFLVSYNDRDSLNSFDLLSRCVNFILISQLVRLFSNYQWQCRYETSRWYLKSRKESKITVKVSFKLWYFLHFLINQQLSGKSKAWSKQGIFFYQPRKILVFLVLVSTKNLNSNIQKTDHKI